MSSSTKNYNKNKKPFHFKLSSFSVFRHSKAPEVRALELTAAFEGSLIQLPHKETVCARQQGL